MTDEILPTFIQRLAQFDEHKEALKWCETDEERLAVHAMCDNRETAQQYAHDVLQTHDVTDIDVHDDSVTVYCGPFTGYHSIKRDEQGHPFVAHDGQYVHDPTDVSFDAECPQSQTLDRRFERATNVPARGDAARSAFMRSRRS